MSEIKIGGTTFNAENVLEQFPSFKDFQDAYAGKLKVDLKDAYKQLGGKMYTPKKKKKEDSSED